MGIDQLGREQAVANELLWTIQVRSDEIEQFCPLHEALFNSRHSWLLRSAGMTSSAHGRVRPCVSV